MKTRFALYPIIIIIASLVVHFLFFGHPNETVFDEVHFGKFISGYFTHEYFFDIHPPLGKLLISGMGYLAGFKPGFSFAEIGQKFPDNIYLWLRLLPTLAGALLPLIIFFLVLQLGLSRLTAFSTAMLVVFENALLVQSRFILLDPFLLLFGFSALLAYFKYAQGSKNFYLILSGALAALSLSVKWTGATFLCLIVILEVIKIIREKSWNRLFKDLAVLVVFPPLIYFSVFAVHLNLLNKSGPGDAFMTPAFQKTLAGNNYQQNPDIKPLNLLEKFKELNIEMYRANANLTAGHPYSSKWYSWPFMIRPIYYWTSPCRDCLRVEPNFLRLLTVFRLSDFNVWVNLGSQSRQIAISGTTSSAVPSPCRDCPAPDDQSRIYFLGNPVVWWASTIAVLFLLLETLPQAIKTIENGMAGAFLRVNKLRLFLLGSFVLNLLPFIGIKRAMFLYHYLIALIFAIIMLAYLIDRLEKRERAWIIIFFLAFAGFVFFAPLSYGLSLDNPAYNLRTWLPTWR